MRLRRTAGGNRPRRRHGLWLGLLLHDATAAAVASTVMSSLASVRPERVPRRAGARRSTTYWVCLLLVLATVSWRPDTLYSGGLDAVVVAKAVLSIVALTMAWNTRLASSERQPVRTAAVWFVLAYVAIATFGAWSTSDVAPSAVLGARMLIIALSVLLLARSVDREELLRAWLSALLAVGLVAAVTGLPSLASGRLGGGVPPLHPNELAVLCGLPAVGLSWLLLYRRARATHAVLLTLMLAVLWLTGSRTSLLATIGAIVVLGVQAHRLSRPTVVGAVCALYALIYVMTATSVFDAFFLRGGAESVATLNSRTIGWSAAFSFSDSEWVRWMGAGLTMKEIPVAGQYWQTQFLDSSWVSAIAQAGRAGAIVLVMWVLYVIVAALSDRAQRAALTGLLAFVLVNSFAQTGLVDSTPNFITFFLISVLVGVNNRQLPHPAVALRASPAVLSVRS